MITKKVQITFVLLMFLSFRAVRKNNEKNKRCSDYMGFTDVFECGLSSQASRVRSEDVM